MRVILALCTLFLITGPCMANGPANSSSAVKVFRSGEPFEDVVDNIKMAIVERGLLVSGTLHVSDMLNRTAPDLGYAEVFAKAESVEFCSALISHKMAQAAPENIAICPFTIAVYVKQTDAEQVYVAYRSPHLAGKGKEVADEIIALMEGIIEDSI
ncbi:MAG: DUF302 domain-containing protein [Candidatus Thiodiazotropha endolucinida]